MRRFAGACRFVFNRALARQNENHEAGNKYIPYGKMASWLVEWKNATETQWLKDSPSQPLQQSLKDLERAYKNFFRKRAAFPRFKKRGQNDAFRYPQGVKLDQENSRIFLPKVLCTDLPWLQEIGRPRPSRRLPVVLTPDEVVRILGFLEGEHRLFAQLLYGTGMRISEGLQLRVKDLDFDHGTIIVREGKGSKDRALMLPESLAPSLLILNGSSN